MKEITTTIFKSLDKLIGFITEEYNRELKPNYIKVESRSRKNRMNR
ncbi:hypothetical protein [Tenacibaculum agarivorans]|nr:hypothetical protein [Tenacibaculum agarivorans]